MRMHAVDLVSVAKESLNLGNYHSYQMLKVAQKVGRWTTAVACATYLCQAAKFPATR